MKIYHEIRNDIISCKFLPNGKLPSENELKKHYKVSRHTIQHAFQLLVNEGLVIKRQGQASFVRPMNKNGAMTQTLHLGSLNQPGILLTDFCFHFARRVHELTTGAVNIQIHHSSELGEGYQQIHNVKTGEQDMFCAAIDWLSEIDSEWTIASYPFLFRDIEHLQSAVNNDISEQMRQRLLEKHGVRVVSDNWYRPSRLLISTKPCIQESDIKGLRIGIPSIPLYEQVWSALGATTVHVNWGERKAAFEKGLIDATDLNWDIILSECLHHVAPFATLTNHLYSRACIVINEEKFQTLRIDAQQAIIQASHEMGNDYFSHIFGAFNEHKKQLISENMTFIETNVNTWRHTVEKYLQLNQVLENKSSQLYTQIRNLV